MLEYPLFVWERQFGSRVRGLYCVVPWSNLTDASRIGLSCPYWLIRRARLIASLGAATLKNNEAK